jgi:hypothetical protein
MFLCRYHNGFFNTNQLIVTANNNAQIENNNQIEQNENRIPGIQRLQNQLTNFNEFPIGIYHNEHIERRPGVLLYTWIFLSSFITSLVPDNPNIG